MVIPEPLPADFIPEPSLLCGRNLLVTGAHTDLGHTITTALASHGASLILCTRKESMLAELYDTLMVKQYPEPLLVVMNLQQANEAEFDKLANGLRDMVGTLHGAVLLDIPAVPLSPVTLSTLKTWETCLQRTLWQPLQLVRAILPLLQDTDSPSVVFHTLPCGHQGKAYWGALGCALAGLQNLCQTLSEEHPNIRFNTLDIGPVDSDLRRRLYPGENRSTLRSIDDPKVANSFLQLLSGLGRSSSGKAFQLT